MTQGKKSNLTALEKYELAKERTKIWKQKKKESDPEYMLKIREYSREYAKKIREEAYVERVLKQT